MRLTVTYNPEMNVYAVHNGVAERIIVPAELEPGGRYAPCRQIFEQARAAVVEGRAISGVTVEV
jgi:hypothetical protein